ncbi:MAG: ribosomal protein S18-alanine N-acetyltransferase [Terriglobales bacterium]
MLISIRCAELNDVPAILAIERQAVGASHWTFEHYNRLVGSGVVLIAELAAQHPPEGAPAAGKSRKERGTLCGFVCAPAVAGEWEIENVVVAREALRRGIANELMRELIERARAAAASAILLEVRESNRAARGLYEKHGFREVGRRSAYYADPVEDSILYSLRFDHGS